MQLIYFVDFCVTGCRFKGFNYTTVYRWWNNPNLYSNCYCVTTFNFGSPNPTSCDLTCLSRDGERYSCGNSGGTWWLRSVYLNF